ncbi:MULTISPECIES: sporulation protein Cse60 [Bacillaceae]|uniref:sporulation protein Cse60 n=1 Tax=Bacillaceae TaxID=186817 RepID=UPI001C876760|nr:MULTISPECIES: sporulation protein Cse60 [Bacillaceae]
MLQVKLFEAEHEQDLEEEINEFLTQLHESKFIDIKYEVSMAVDEDTEDFESLYSFSAMILYRA